MTIARPGAVKTESAPRALAAICFAGEPTGRVPETCPAEWPFSLLFTPAK
jgi:hypothetical protein